MQKIEPAQFEDLFEQRLEEYDEDRAMVAKEKKEQDVLVAKLREANSVFVSARRGDTSTKEREDALQTLETAYVKFKEIISNLNDARKFYNELAGIVNRFCDDCRTFAYQRRVEAGQLETDLATNMSSLSISRNQQPQPQLQIQPESQVRNSPRQQFQENRRPYQPSKQAPEPPLAAPTPTRPPAPAQPNVATPGMWNPEQGIKFAGGAPGQASPVAKGSVPGLGNRSNQNGQWSAANGIRFG